MPAGEIDKLIGESSTEAGGTRDLVRAVISEESGSCPCVVSPKEAQDLMQLMPETAGLFGGNDPFDPKENVDAHEAAETVDREVRGAASARRSRATTPARAAWISRVERPSLRKPSIT
jgi:hypothetical protein